MIPVSPGTFLETAHMGYTLCNAPINGKGHTSVYWGLTSTSLRLLKAVF